MNTPFSREEDLFFDDEFLEDYPDADSLFIQELDDALQAKFAGTPWEARLKTLAESTPWEDRVRLYQELRAAQALPEPATFFLIVWAIEGLAEDRISTNYETVFFRRIEKIRRDHGMSEFDDWEPGKEPSEYMELMEEFNKSADAVTRATYQTFGEYAYLEMQDKDPDRADHLYEEGHNFIEDLIDDFFSIEEQ